MHIFIDESGSFSGIGQSSPNISAAGALIIEDYRLNRLFKDYEKIRRRLPKEKSEVKGKLIEESHADEIFKMLRHHNALFFVSVIDLSCHTLAGIQEHKQQYTERLTLGLTGENNNPGSQIAWAFRRRLENMNLPLYIQSIANFALIENLLNHVTCYFALKAPRELEFFHWTVDAKEKSFSPTDWEDWWTRIALPDLEQRSRERPVPRIKNGNYKYFSRFLVKDEEFNSENETINLNLLLNEQFSFSSEINFGIELADVATTVMRRSLKGNFQETGWKYLAKLTMNQNSPSNINFISLEKNIIHIPPWRYIADSFRKVGYKY